MNLSEQEVYSGTRSGVRKPAKSDNVMNNQSDIGQSALNTKLIKGTVLTVILLIVVTHFIMQSLYESDPDSFHFDGLFTITDLDMEQSFGTFTSQLLFVLSALIFAIRFLLHKPGKDKFILAVLAAGLFGMAVDESISLHERTMNIIATFTDFGPGSFFRFQWLLFGLPLAILMVLSLIYLIRTTTLKLNFFLIGLFVFFCGAVGLEGIGGVINPSHYNYHVWMTGLEETVELIGVYLIFVSQLNWLRDRSPVRIPVK